MADEGRKIRWFRDRKGLTQEELAYRARVSKSLISQVERGVKSVGQWRVVVRLAEALDCLPSDLVGENLELAPNGGVAFQALPSVRSLLTGYDFMVSALDPVSPPGAAEPVADVSALEREFTVANEQYQAAHYEEAARGLVRALRSAERSRLARSSDPRAVDALLALGYQTVSKTLGRVDEAELSWIAAERAGAAAERSEDAHLIASTLYHLSHAHRRAGRVEAALTVAERGYEAIDRRYVASSRDASYFALAGGLTLTAAVAAASDDDHTSAEDLLERAGTIADELGQDRNEFWFAFGPTNVEIHKLSVAVETGRAREAVKLGEGIDVDALPRGLTGRRSAVLIDRARAYAQLRMDAAAVNMLVEAERISRQTLLYSRWVHGVVRELLSREHRASTPQLRPLAVRLGIIEGL